MTQRSLTSPDAIPGHQAVHAARIINVLALLGLILVLSGSLILQFGFGERPCPLCLIQRSAMVGLAVGPAMNLLWGMRPAHYAVSILAAMMGGAASIRQILLHIVPPDDGFGPAILGFHLYTWSFITFAIAIVGCAVMLLWTTPFLQEDGGVRHERRWFRIFALTSVYWAFGYLIIMGLGVAFECKTSLCPDDPENWAGLGPLGGAAITAAVGLVAFAIATAVVHNQIVKTSALAREREP